MINQETIQGESGKIVYSFTLTVDDSCNDLESEKVSKISFEDWVRSWFIDTAECCSGCLEEIHFWDEVYQHSDLEGVFCLRCAQAWKSGSAPILLK